MRIAVLGGTFNPLHIGHCMLADSVLCDLNYDKVLFVPANIPPHKKMNDTVSAEDRFLMIDAFCKSASNDGNERFPPKIAKLSAAAFLTPAIRCIV